MYILYIKNALDWFIMYSYSIYKSIHFIMADHIVICGHDGSHNRRLTCTGAGNLLVDDVTSHGVLSNIDTELEGLTTLLTAANVNTAHLSDDLDGLSTNQGVIYTELGNHSTLLTTANAHLSEIEGCVASSRLQVNTNIPFGSTVSLASAQAISGGSTWTSPEIANNAGDQYTIQFTNSIDDSISYSIVGSMTSGGTTYTLPYFDFNMSGSPESGIAGLAVVDGVYTPFFKIVATNANMSTQSTTLDYVKW
jgi:hypothetical protein